MFYCNKEKTDQYYSSNGQVICQVPMHRFAGVNLTKEGKPEALRYITNVHPEFGTKWRLYKDLRGLNIEDFEAWQVDLVVYVLEDGTLLAADKLACEKAGEAINSASNVGAKCFEHLLVDLVVLKEMPLKTGEVEKYPHLKAFDFGAA